MKKITTKIENLLYFVEEYSSEYSRHDFPFMDTFLKEADEKYLGGYEYLENIQIFSKDVVYSKFFNETFEVEYYNEFVREWLKDSDNDIIRLVKYEELREETQIIAINPLTEDEVLLYEIDSNLFDEYRFNKDINRENEALKHLLEQLEIYNDNDLTLYEKIEHLGSEVLKFSAYAHGYSSDEHLEIYKQYETIERVIKLEKELEQAKKQITKKVKI